MRVILFRGKNFEGKWVKGYYVFDEKYQKHEIYTGGYTDSGHFQESDCLTSYEVQPETLGQYTCCKDKNGTEIFEGDIVLHELASESYIVTWHKGKGFRLERITEIPCDDFYLSEIFCEEYARVVGNIYDNPEML